MKNKDDSNNDDNNSNHHPPHGNTTRWCHSPTIWYVQTSLILFWCSLFQLFCQTSSPPMSIEEGSNETTEAEDTAETVNSFEIAEAVAETAEMRNQPYNAADWMQPAAAWWILTPSSKLSRWELWFACQCFFFPLPVFMVRTTVNSFQENCMKRQAS